MFRQYIGDLSLIDTIYELNRQISFSNTFYHKIILNKDGSFVTYIDNKPYVMLKLSNLSSDSISIFDIKGIDYVHVDKKMEPLNLFYWTYFWENKIDYFENQITSNLFQYHFLLPSFYYFLGLGENAILYVKMALENFEGDKTDQLVVSHRRFYKSTTLIDFYDPFNLVLDHKTRDVAEYIKYLFLNADYDSDVLNEYLERLNLSSLGAHLLFGRLLFPSFYFDMLENFFSNGDYSFFKKIEMEVVEYQSFLKEVYFVLKRKYNIMEIDWLLKEE